MIPVGIIIWILVIFEYCEFSIWSLTLFRLKTVFTQNIFNSIRGGFL